MNNLYQTWVTGGSGYAVLQNELIVKARAIMDDNKNKLVINSAGKTNGVYVITADGELVDASQGNADCIGVALITDNQRIMIEKTGHKNKDIIKMAYDADKATNTGYQYFYWGSYGVDTVNTNVLSNDAALKDFNGKTNTAAIIAMSDTDEYTEYANMGTYCKIFNEMDSSFSDWYIPAAGLICEIYANWNSINSAFNNIGGTKFDSLDYSWSSSELSATNAWSVYFDRAAIGCDASNKHSNLIVRLVRDLL